MKNFLLHILLFYVSGLLAADFNLHQGMAGNKMIEISLPDSLEQLDISNISVEGYEIENAVLIQDQGLTYNH